MGKRCSSLGFCHFYIGSISITVFGQANTHVLAHRRMVSFKRGIKIAQGMDLFCVRENGKSTWLSLNKNNQVKCVLRDLNQQTPFLFGTFKCVCWLWGGKSSWVPKSNGPTYLLEKCFSSGGKVCFRFGLGTVVAGYEGCANNTFVFVMKEKNLKKKR